MVGSLTPWICLASAEGLIRGSLDFHSNGLTPAVGSVACASVLNARHNGNQSALNPLRADLWLCITSDMACRGMGSVAVKHTAAVATDVDPPVDGLIGRHHADAS